MCAKTHHTSETLTFKSGNSNSARHHTRWHSHMTRKRKCFDGVRQGNICMVALCSPHNCSHLLPAWNDSFSIMSNSVQVTYGDWDAVYATKQKTMVDNNKSGNRADKVKLKYIILKYFQTKINTCDKSRLEYPGILSGVFSILFGNCVCKHQPLVSPWNWVFHPNRKKQIAACESGTL